MRKFLLLAVMASYAITVHARSNQWNVESAISSDTPIEVPGMVLEPGVYIFSTDSEKASRKVITIYNENKTQFLTQFIGIGDYRTRPIDGSEFVFHEMTTLGPRTMRSWYAAGEAAGLEFVYPKARGAEIAAATQERVAAADSPEAEIVAVSANGKEVWLMDAVKDEAPAEPESEIAAADPPTSELPTMLPATAANNLLLLIFGLTSLSGSACARSKRSF